MVDPEQYHTKEMQLEVGSEPYLSIAQALCLLISPIFYYKSIANWQRIGKFQIHSYNTFRDMNYYPVTDGLTDRRTEINA